MTSRNRLFSAGKTALATSILALGLAGCDQKEDMSKVLSLTCRGTPYGSEFKMTVAQAKIDKDGTHFKVGDTWHHFSPGVPCVVEDLTPKG